MPRLEFLLIMFKFVVYENYNPHFNLASEEYLLKNKEDYYIYVWKNAPSVIIGVNQNAYEEVNFSYLNSHDIKLARRITGGGAVYHDLDNVNYTIIAPLSSSENAYKEFTTPVINYLNSIGVKAEFSGRNDIVVDGKKISGNAESVYKNRIMHHGTLLFKTDLEALTNVLKPNKFKTESKGIKSIRARVDNISSFTDISSTQFFRGLQEYLSKGLEIFTFSNEDIKNINKLTEEKFATNDWVYGKSPKAENIFSEKFSFGIFNLYFDTEKGKIVNAETFGDFFSFKDIKEFSSSLIGLDFNKEAFKKAFSSIGEYIVGANGNEIVEKMFS